MLRENERYGIIVAIAARPGRRGPRRCSSRCRRATPKRDIATRLCARAPASRRRRTAQPCARLAAGRAIARPATSALTMEGFMFPATYELTTRGPADELVAQQLAAFRSAEAQVDYRPRAQGEPDKLRRADHRLDDRARGRLPRRPPQDRGRDLEPPARRTCRSASTPRSSTRSARGSRSPGADLELTGRYNTRKTTACRRPPICNPGLASLKAAANPAPRRLPLLRRDPGRCQATALLLAPATTTFHALPGGAPG